MLRSPKKEEQQLPVGTYQDLEILDDLQGFLGIKGNDNSFNEEQQEDGDGHRIMSYKAQQQMPINSTCDAHYLFHWDLSSSLNMWEHELSFPTPQSTGDEISNAGNSNVKKEAAVGDYWEDAVEETEASLKLNLNYERVLEAWSNRGSLWAQHHHHPSFPLLSDNNYVSAFSPKIILSYLIFGSTSCFSFLLAYW